MRGFQRVPGRDGGQVPSAQARSLPASGQRTGLEHLQREVGGRVGGGQAWGISVVVVGPRLAEGQPGAGTGYGGSGGRLCRDVRCTGHATQVLCTAAVEARRSGQASWCIESHPHQPVSSSTSTELEGGVELIRNTKTRSSALVQGAATEMGWKAVRRRRRVGSCPERLR